MRLPYLERLARGVFLFDGAMGTMLYEKGISLKECFENANFVAPEKVLEIHAGMAEAGAEALTTNSFGANPVRLASYGLEEQTAAINIESVKLARQVAGDELYVAGSVGPLGARLAPVGELSRQEAEEAFARQISALLEGGVDLLILETFRNLDELLLAARAARELAGNLPIHAQFSFRPHRGDEVQEEEFVRIFNRLECDPSSDVIGLNCSTGPAYMLDVLQAVQGVAGKPIAVMPNAGFPRDFEGRQLYMASPEYFAEYALKFLEAGASVIGGCCGTTPEHIRKMGHAILSRGAAERHRVEVRSRIECETVQEPPPLAERSAFGRALAEGRWITSVEVVPPRGTSLEKSLAKARTLAGHGVTAVNIPDGPRASSRISSLVTAIELQRQGGPESIQHVCCRDKNIIGIQSELLGSHAAGLRNLLLITGDPPKEGNYPEATGVFDIDSIGLISLARTLNHGLDLAGKEIHEPTSFVIGSGANPAAPLFTKEIDRTFAKAEAGAEFFITQPVFDVELLLRFLEAIRDTGKPVIAGVWPLSSYRNALFLHHEVPGIIIPLSIRERMRRCTAREEARDEGVRIAREIITDIRDAISGIQVSPPFGRIDTALRVLEP
jgi:homocysteine S-methyltransferase